MSFRKLFYKVLPLKAFVSLRKVYRKALKTFYKPLSEEAFRNVLINDIGIQQGSVIFIHSSIDALNISFSAFRLLEILLEIVGKSGTLVFPAWHFTYRAEEYLNKNLVFNVQSSPSVLGLLSELARRHPEAVRSVHPTNSIVAIGKYANEITGEHGSSVYPCDEASPYFKIMKYEGIIIGLGVNNNFLSFVHCPEDVLKNKFPVKTRLDKIFDAKVKMQDGSEKIVKTLAAHPQIRNNDIPGFISKNIPASVCRNFKIKGNRFFIAHSPELFECMVTLARHGKTIYTNAATVRN